MSNRTLLIVDDETALTDVIAHRLGLSLKVLDVNIKTFNDPLELLKEIETNGMPLAVMTDDLMPGMLGRELAKELRLRGFHGMILMLSGTADEEVLAWGVSTLLTKPARIRQVLEILEPAFAPPAA
jgi:FixJ family two-component response regulator